MTFKTAASRFGNAILDAGSAIHNASIDSKITEIDEESDALRKQMTRLEERRSELVADKI